MKHKDFRGNVTQDDCGVYKVVLDGITFYVVSKNDSDAIDLLKKYHKGDKYSSSFTCQKYISMIEEEQDAIFTKERWWGRDKEKVNINDTGKMRKRYSNWFSEYVYDMSEQQEKHLIDNGFVITKPELNEYDDSKIRDIPHRIERNKEDCASLVYNTKQGKFYIQVNQHAFHIVDDMKAIIDRMEFLTKVMGEMQEIE